MNKVIAALFLGLISFSCLGSDRNILQNEAARIGLDALLKEDIFVSQFPGYDNRLFWDAVPEHISKQYIQEAEEYLGFPWPAIKATDYLEIIRTGNRLHSHFILPHNVLRALIIAELIEGDGRFIDQIVNGVWYYCEQTWWGWSAHLKDQREADGLPDVDEPTIDLGTGEIANTLAMAWLLFKKEFDLIHPLISRRLKSEVMRKAIIPFYERDDFWWMGFIDWYDPDADSPRRLNNWNTWINYNMLLAILILEDDPGKRVKGVNRVLHSIDMLINSYPDDGGCDEGPSYWKKAGGFMYLSLHLLEHVTEGRFNVYDNQLIKNMGAYIYKACIDYPYFLNFADADAIESSYPDIIYLYGKDINNPVMQQFGTYIAHKEGWANNAPRGNIDRLIIQLKNYDEILNAPAKNPLIPDFWLPDTELAGARDKEGTNKGFYFAAKGGYNDESHNHNDVGTFLLYYDGTPCLIDIGRETYTAETFGPNRYDIWNMQSRYHNLPVINSCDQECGPQYRAVNTSFKSDKRNAVFTTNIAGAYPEKAGIDLWNRTYTLNRGNSFIIEDEFMLSKSGSPLLNLISYCNVIKLEDGLFELEGENFKLHLYYDPEKLTAATEFMEVTDARLYNFWPKGITRMVFTYNAIVKSDKNIIEIKKAN